MNAQVRATLDLKSKLLERYGDQIDGILGCHDWVKTGGQIGRSLKRLRLHGPIKKTGKTYKYHLTELDQRAVLVGLK